MNLILVSLSLFNRIPNSFWYFINPLFEQPFTAIPFKAEIQLYKFINQKRIRRNLIRYTFTNFIIIIDKNNNRYLNRMTKNIGKY